jgi:hypothetical protein
VNHRYHKHYTRAEAQALLPRIRQWLERLDELRRKVDAAEKRIASLMQPGCDVGGDSVNRWIRDLAEIQGLLAEFRRREILVKDVERGLVDFPALIGGREVFLCWEKDEEQVEFWHELDAGYAGREPLG